MASQQVDAPHLCAQLQYKVPVPLAASGSVQACLAESAKEGVQQGKGQWPLRRAPAVQFVAIFMQICLLPAIAGKCRRRSH